MPSSTLATSSSRITLNDGHSIPQLGFGVYLSRTPYESALAALTKGPYRHLDCAVIYKNEKEVGDALRKSGLKREEVFVTTKLQTLPKDGDVLRAAREGVERFGLDYVDLFLIHDPSIGKESRLKIWEALRQLKKEGKTRSIGVSNYNVHHLKELEEVSDEMPAVNQVELNPHCQYRKVVEYCRAKGIMMEAYCPLASGQRWDDKTIQSIAKAHKRDPAQIMLRWSLQKGNVVLTKSDNPERIVSNSNIFDFELSQEDMDRLDALDGPNSWTCWDVIEAP